MFDQQLYNKLYYLKNREYLIEKNKINREKRGGYKPKQTNFKPDLVYIFKYNEDGEVSESKIYDQNNKKYL